MRRSFNQRDLVSALEVAIHSHGKPGGILTDNGLEFTTPGYRTWAKDQGIDLFYIRPGRPVENAFIESFNGRLRDECLSRNAFERSSEADEIIEAWRIYYNDERPHSSLGNLTPTEFMKRCELGKAK